MTLETIEQSLDTLEGSAARVNGLISEIFEALRLQEAPTEAPVPGVEGSRLDGVVQRIFSIHHNNQQQVDRLQTVVAELAGVDGPVPTGPVRARYRDG